MQEPHIYIGPASAKQELFLNSSTTITLCGGAAGSGKALRHGEKILTPSGFMNIEEIAVGDSVVTPKNTIEKVLGVYPQGEVDIYRVCFQDGTSVEVCGEHLWQYHEARGRGKSKVNSTKFLAERISSGFRPLIPLTEPVDVSNNYRPLPVKPYTLGVLLGDGSMSTKSVSFTTDDQEIFDRVSSDGYELTEWNKNQTQTTAKVFGLSKIQQPLRELNLLGCVSNNKFIPEIYKSASIKDRFSLMQGLMDTDGYIDAGGSVEFCTVSLQLMTDVRWVLHSLGFTATITTKIPTFTYKGEKKTGQLCYILYIRGKNQRKLFNLTRKTSRAVDKNVANRIISITKTSKDFATCISISGEDKLFITTDFIVTHNTFTSLLIALKFMQHPRATGVIFRRTSKMMTAPGSIWHEACSLFSSIYPKGLRIKSRELEIIFPNGALLKFSHMQHENNMYDHKGAQYSLVIFDEATDFTEQMIVYLLSRMRNAYVNYTPQMFLMTNPDFDSFLRLWIQDYYLDEVGIPVPEKAGHKRYFFRQGNTMLWYPNLEAAEAVHGPGHESGITSFTFIGATCRDNPPLLKAQPDYISRLMNMTRVERERLLDGSWFARASTSGLFKREWVTMVPYGNTAARSRVRAWDLAFSLPSEQYPNPDWTAGVLISKDKTSVYTVENVVRMRDRVHEVEKLIFDTAERDGFGVTISIPIDPNAAAGAYAKGLQRRLAEKGYNVRLQKPVKSKVVRFAPFSSIAQATYIQVVIADWNNDFFEELEVFDGESKRKDDQVDACSDCMTLLNKELVLPQMSLPDFSGSPTPSRFSTGTQSPVGLPNFNMQG